MFRSKKSRLSWSHLAIAFLALHRLLNPWVATATQVVPLTLTETVRQADTIVLGTVVSQKTRWGNPSHRWMVTDYTFEVEDLIYASEKTDSIGKTITVTYWGGTLDGETQAISDTRLPVRGERLLLMLKAGWQKVNFSPVVGLNHGLFIVAAEGAGRPATVRDANGSPLVRTPDGTMVKSMPGSNPQSTAPGVELNTFVSWLRSNIAAIKAAPSELPPRVDRNDPRVMKVFSKRPAPDQPKAPNANQGAKETGREPATDSPRGTASAPGAPTSKAPAGFGGFEQVAPTRPSNRPTPDYSYARTANRPIVVNNFPASFAPWSPEDQYQMSKWNYYASDVFRVYTNPTGTWAWQNNVFDLCGWPSSADMQAQFGAPWDSNTIGITYRRWNSSNIIIEADIALNDENFDFTLSDEPIYDGSSLQGFRQVMTHELGHMWGLDHQFNFISVMNYFPAVFRFFGMPYMDDAEAIRVAYPSVAVSRTDLGVYLYYESGYQSVTDATFPSFVTAGDTLTVNNYHLENVGTTTIATPTLQWYLTSTRNYNSSYYYLGTSTYGALARFQYFDPPSTSRTFTVPKSVPGGYYYLNAYVPGGDAGAGQGSFPFSNNYAFSRTTIYIYVPSLYLTSAVSSKMHGGLGPFDINLPLSGAPGVECRSSGGNHTLRFIFTNNVLSGSASVTAGTGSISGSPGFASNSMTVNLTGVADVQKLTVTLNNVTDDFGQVLPNTAISVNMLIGDTTGNKTVNASDVSQTKSQSGLAVTGSNYREDVTVNGSINASDVSLVKSRSGFGVP